MNCAVEVSEEAKSGDPAADMDEHGPAHALRSQRDDVLHIRCLGGFSIQQGVGGPDLTPTTLTRQHELLLRVIAAGPDGAAVDRIVAGIWPLTDPDRRRQSLNTSLSRLRAGFYGANAIVADGDVLRVDASATWVDSLALEALTREVLLPLQRRQERHSLAKLQHWAAQLEGFGQAEFLPALDGVYWVLAARQRIAQDRSRALSRLGGRKHGK
ncbi:MAG: hypothetical protein SF172_06740 [Burkholderiales bacterium]|nr:hypothetical protein [Burkholderiales bacterium]